ncbi:MAG: hypothetical protein KA524_06605 [Nitrosomonas sp.]|nr:hypothetical protein [Nitrosomonas sp.]MBP6076150.1 hypothetical protein [Nitrosomonas sp.]
MDIDSLALGKSSVNRGFEFNQISSEGGVDLNSSFSKAVRIFSVGASSFFIEIVPQ